jgi:mono/diheme cytochrome c family protein
VYYSIGVVDWLVRREADPRDPDNVLPDGAMIVKEMYPPLVPASAKERKEDVVSGWAVMVRDSTVSHDGWLWYLYYLPDNTTNNREFEMAQYGMSFCVSCHASTSNIEGTFSALGNITGQDIVNYVNVPAAKNLPAPPTKTGGHSPPSAAAIGADCASPNELPLIECLSYHPITDPLPEPDPEILATYGLLAPVTPDRMPSDVVFDHVVMGPDNHTGLVTADACEGCHDATNQLKASMTHMIVPLPPKQPFERLNLGQMGEWTGSLMSRSARDPLFRAQAEYEIANAPEHKQEILSTCMRCHAPMGQLQLEKDKGEEAALTLEMLDAVPGGSEAGAALYGSLGRDGVSCAVCHRITGKDLGSKNSYNGHFTLGPPDEIYGPYQDVNERLMERGLGMTPQHATQITDSALCGSCHTAYLPVYGSKPAKKAYEQTTYLEWKNSSFADATSPENKSCVACHMPNTSPLDESKLSFKIANFEDATFPYVPNRMSEDELATTERPDFRRHTLVGVNRFVQAMFSQFPGLLGASTFEPNRSATTAPSQILAQISTAELAREGTASLEVQAVLSDKRIEATVKIVNKAGHKLPTGVGFRRAFVEIAVLDATGKQLWCSGCTNGQGLILGADDKPLPSEYDDRMAFEPNREVISSQDEVQIYESRHTDCKNQLTTSFMHLCNNVKDNRILPVGWSPNFEGAQITQPEGVPTPYTPGQDVIKVSLPASLVKSAKEVRARLIYQAMPPYYLRDRFDLLQTSDAPNTKRLAYMVSHLNVAEEKDFTKPDLASDIVDWKLLLTEGRSPIVPAAVITQKKSGD